MAFPCPCCGSSVFSEPPGSCETCDVCRWEDDPFQLRFPLVAGGANRMSLFMAQRAFIAAGKEARDRDPFWRPLDRRRDFLEPQSDDPDVDTGLTGPSHSEELYYWSTNYWLRRDDQRYLYGRYCPVPRQSFSEAEVPQARKQLFAATRALADDGAGAAGHGDLLSFGGKSLLYLAAFRQGDQFGLDQRQQAYFRALWYALTEPDAGASNAALVRALAAAALVESQ
ncbi:MAG TPA: CPCC family cysteine-rich protein [Verrucomicrobiae bacterium]|nr:CPCC family cysteine-rich protein [Verrucomicrobiae bacterium]